MQPGTHGKLVPCLSILLAATTLSAHAQPEKEDGQWRGSVSANASYASGNTDARSFGLSADGTRATPADKISLNLSALNGVQKDVSTGVETKTASQARLGGRYDWNLSERSYTFYSLDFEHDALQDLKLRSSLGLGFGYKVIKSETDTVSLLAGYSYSHENYTTLQRNTPELMLGEESSHKLSDTTSAKQRLSVFDNLHAPGTYRAQFDASLVTAISEGLNLKLTLSERYNRAALPGTRKNDVLFLVGLNLAFGPKAEKTDR
jgi:putative salt-induced outer membrane protein